MTQHATGKTSGSRFILYFVDIIGELKKVVWLSRREIVYLSILVLIVSGAAGLILGALDFGFTALIDKVLLGR